MRQRINERRVNGKYRIEEIGKADAMCFRDQAKQSSVAIEAPWAALFHDLDVSLVMTIEQGIRYATARVLIGEFNSFSP